MFETVNTLQVYALFKCCPSIHVHTMRIKFVVVINTPSQKTFLFPLFKKTFRVNNLISSVKQNTNTVCGTGIIQANSSLNGRLHLRRQKIITIFHTYQSSS